MGMVVNINVNLFPLSLCWNKFSQEWVAPDYWQGHMGLKTWFSSTKMSKESVLVWLDLIWGFQICKFKNPPLEHKKYGPFFSLFLMKKPLSHGQRVFLRPWFLIIGGILVLKSGLGFSFWAQKALGKWFPHEEKWEKGPYFFRLWGEDF